MKVAKLGNVWVKCDLKIIDRKTMKWKKLSSVIDTPKHIYDEKIRLEKLGYKNLWVFHVYGKEPLF